MDANERLERLQEVLMEMYEEVIRIEKKWKETIDPNDTTALLIGINTSMRLREWADKISDRVFP